MRRGRSVTRRGRRVLCSGSWKDLLIARAGVKPPPGQQASAGQGMVRGATPASMAPAQTPNPQDTKSSLAVARVAPTESPEGTVVPSILAIRRARGAVRTRATWSSSPSQARDDHMITGGAAVEAKPTGHLSSRWNRGQVAVSMSVIDWRAGQKGARAGVTRFLATTLRLTSQGQGARKKKKMKTQWRHPTARQLRDTFTLLSLAFGIRSSGPYLTVALTRTSR